MAKRPNKPADAGQASGDVEHLQPDQATLQLPEVKDIPGQEYIHVPPGGILADDTVSSEDEEEKSVLDDTTDEDIIQDNRESKEFPPGSLPMDEDDRNILKNSLEDSDTDGDPLNESS